MRDLPAGIQALIDGPVTDAKIERALDKADELMTLGIVSRADLNDPNIMRAANVHVGRMDVGGNAANSASEYLEAGANVYRQGSISAREPGLIERGSDALSKALEASGMVSDPYRARQAAGGMMFASEFAPGVGEAQDTARAMDSYREGNYLDAGLNATAAAVGVIPVAGDLAARGVRSFRDYAREQVADRSSLALPNPSRRSTDEAITRENEWQRLEKSTKNAGVKRNKDGSYVGGPKNIKTPQARTAVVNKYDERTQRALDAGIPPGYFYEEGRGALSRATDNPAEHEMVSQLYGPTSTQVGPYDNTNYVLRALDQDAVGVPSSVTMYPNSQRRKVDSIVNGENPWQGYKTSRYGYQLGPRDPHVNPMQQMPPNDQWENLGVGGKQVPPSGPAQTAWADDIRRRVADRVNKRRVADGLPPLTLEEVQELHWAAIRAESDGRPLQLNPKDTVQDSLPSFQVQHAWEAEPGGTSGIERLTGKDEYSDEVFGLLSDEQGKDKLIRSMGGRMQSPVVRGTGVWEGELNPGFQSRSYGSWTQSRGMDESSAARIDSTEAVRQYALGQEGRAYSLMDPSAPASKRNMAKVDTGSPPSKEETAKLQEMLGDAGIIAPTENGYQIVSIGPEGKEFTAAVEKIADNAQFGINLGDYNEMDWAGGNATQGLLDTLDAAPPGMARKADSPETRAIMGDISSLYKRLEGEGKLKANQSLTRALDAWSSGGLDAVRALVQQGLAPVALVALLASRGQQDQPAAPES